MRAYLPRPSRRLAGKPPSRQPNHREVLRLDVSCGGRRVRASLPDQNAQTGEQAENGAEPSHAPSSPAAVERAEPPGFVVGRNILLRLEQRTNPECRLAGSMMTHACISMKLETVKSLGRSQRTASA
ncbi:hypothetical protein CHARACLAT_006635 [Characodon lateralis]|uniref:Uncharacterized protein n=1 Tax=Characodon lateralis TaxID=208331 RepID=A0ABU7ERX8_9TELE|nr:hypothetical protein [Characodon lateralis]